MRSRPRSTRPGTFSAARKDDEAVYRGRPATEGVACRMTATSFTPDELAAGEALFRRPWHFLKSVPELTGLPGAERPEICFAGCSNVGKSSIIKQLVWSDFGRTYTMTG